MPKIVDHEERKKRIAEAMWRVILDKGMEGATVRNIAEEAGLSLGALRYYFQTQDDLLVYAMELVINRANARIKVVIQRDLPPKERVIATLLECVPVDTESLAEMSVWFAFKAHIKHRNSTLDAPNDGLLEGMQKLISYLHTMDLLKIDLNLDLEVERLYALIDGIAMHALLDPERLNSDRVIKTIHYHINSICNK
ncbi:TetR/AcrR family transcriptional regulator [Paenibacillus sp. FA6]|uniref:TetR/AcrR family transcriptional regulator n=1 Tax=Paenibacillus sp. FA6 TaxID=3413029 RepID=UPI003F65BAD3